MNENSQQSPDKVRRRRHGEPPQVDKEWYSKAEAAQYLGVAEITITRYLEKGILHAHRLPTPGVSSANTDAGPKHTRYDYGRLRIHKSELDHYLGRADRRPNESVAHGYAGHNIYNSDNDAAASTIRATATPATPATPDEDGEIITRPEAALRLGVSWRTIDRYIKSGVLRLAGYFRCPDSYTRVHVYRSDVEKLL